MKITEVRPFVVHCYRTNWVFVKVLTDEGLCGVGEGTLEGRELTTVSAINELSRVLLRENPFAIEGLQMRMQRDSYWRTGPVLSTAQSAVEMALWDIKGQALGVPVYELLGGLVRDRIPVYANSWFFGAKCPSEFSDKAVAAVAQGFRGLKWDPFGRAYQCLTTAELNAVLGNVAAIRQAVGPDVDLMIEGHGRFSVMTAIQLGRELAAFRVRWFEEPVLPDRARTLASVRRAIPVPVAAGERAYSRFDCADLLDAEAVDVLQPDVCHVGGLLEMKRVAAMADAAHLPIAPHNPYGPVCHAASLHFAAACHNFLVLETMVTDVPWRRDISTEDWVFEDGCFVVPSKPGLGLELREAAFDKYPYQPRDLRHYAGTLTDIRPPDARRWF